MSSPETIWCVLQRYSVGLLPGDSVVVATDGMLDNVFESEVAAAVTTLRHQGHKCSEVAKKLSEIAHSHALKTQGDTPFAVGARELGKHWDGGKMDDITVLVAYVT